jgi:hypothetical protein
MVEQLEKPGLALERFHLWAFTVPFNHAPRQPDRGEPEEHATQGLPDQHARRPKPRAKEQNEGDGSKGVAAPVEPCRIVWVTEVIEGRVRNEKRPVEEKRERQRAAEKEQKLSRNTCRVEQGRDLAAQEITTTTTPVKISASLKAPRTLSVCFAPAF